MACCHVFVVVLQIIQDLILESNRNSREQSRAEVDLQSVEKKNGEIRNALESAKAEVVRLQVRPVFACDVSAVGGAVS